MTRIRSLLIAGAAGAAAAYFLDPEHGAARRSRLRAGIEEVARELLDRAGAAIGRGGAVAAPRPDDDLSLLNRVESALLGLPGVPKGAVETEVVDRQVVLRGRVASVEQEREVVATAGRIAGVAGVESLLRVAG